LDRCYVEWAEPRWRRGQRLRRALEVLSVDWERSARDEMSPRTLSVRARVSKDERPGRPPKGPKKPAVGWAKSPARVRCAVGRRRCRPRKLTLWQRRCASRPRGSWPSKCCTVLIPRRWGSYGIKRSKIFDARPCPPVFPELPKAFSSGAPRSPAAAPPVRQNKRQLKWSEEGT